MRSPIVVLIVDDYADTRELYSLYLASLGYRVEEAADGVDGLDKVRALPPDVILMDLSMPRRDGWELTRLLKGDPLTRAIPILVLTAHGSGTERERAFAAGCDAFFTKPMTPHLVAEAIARELSKRMPPS